MNRRTLLAAATAVTVVPAVIRSGAISSGAISSGAISSAWAQTAETSVIRLSHGYGILYLPLMVMRHRKLLEGQLERMGLPVANVTWALFDGGNVINDAMLAGALDIAGTGAPGFVTLWAKARGIPRAEVVGVSGLSSCALSLNVNREHIKTLADFGPNDKIALPGIKTSLAAVVLQMLVAAKFGAENYAKLDPITVGLPHPEAYGALMSGRTEIAAHFASPPYSILELKDPRIHRVVAASEVLGDGTLDVVFAPRRFVDANPRTMAAFLAALDEANALIAAHPEQAAEAFIAMAAAKMGPDDVLAMVRDRDTRFDTTPHGVMAYAMFMKSVGSIKQAPAQWSDMFMSSLKDRPGS